MAPPSLGSSRVRPEFNIAAHALPRWTHPEVTYWFDRWRMIRDACAGSRAVKDQAQTYLPQLEGMDDDEYAAYLDRATYYNFSGRTASALTGSIFRRKEMLNGIPESLDDRLKTISKDREPFAIYAEHVADEVIKLGRFGVLVDMPNGPSTTPRPYFASYPAETILDWETSEVDGYNTLTRVVLWELRLVRDTKTFQPKWVSQYRVLTLEQGPEGWTYWQELYTHPTENATLEPQHRLTRFQPMNRGRPLNFIPFHIFGAFLSTPSIEKPPLEDIADLNISHYRSYANLEHGRLFTGFPMYYVESGIGGEQEGEFTLGATRVWQTPPGAKPGILELNGQGLKFLVDALDQKEQQAAALGGRMMGVRTTAVAESDNMLKLSERNEQSQLLKVTRSLDHGFTILLRWWARMQDVTEARANEIEVEFNKDFLFDGVGAREFRAVHAMYKDGVLPIDVLYYYFKRGNLIPDWMDLKEFKRLLDNMESFPNNPDAQARAEGFPDAAAKLGIKEKGKDRELEQDLLDTQIEADAEAADVAAKAAEKAAKSAAREPAPGQGARGSPGSGGRGGGGGAGG